LDGATIFWHEHGDAPGASAAKATRGVFDVRMRTLKRTQTKARVAHRPPINLPTWIKKMSDSRGIPTGYKPLIGSERPPHPETKRLERAAADERAEVQLIVRRRPDRPALKDLDYFQKVPINARNLPSRLEF
jgi:hypothetical protein